MGMAPQGTYSPAPSGAFFIAASRGAHARCDLDQHKRALTSDVRAMLASGAAIKRYARSPVSPNALSNVLRRLPVGDGASPRDLAPQPSARGFFYDRRTIHRTLTRVCLAGVWAAPGLLVTILQTGTGLHQPTNGWGPVLFWGLLGRKISPAREPSAARAAPRHHYGAVRNVQFEFWRL
jgi:hypothetical protein